MNILRIDRISFLRPKTNFGKLPIFGQNRIFSKKSNKYIDKFTKFLIKKQVFIKHI